MAFRFLPITLFVCFTAGCGLILDFDPPDFPDMSVDADHINSDASTDAGLDATDVTVWMADSATADGSTTSDGSTVDTCSDESGLCIRFTDPDPAEPVIAIMSIMYWTEGGVTVDSMWTTESCIDGLRRIDTATVECHFHADPLPAAHVIYFYPVTASGPRCDATACAGFYMAYSFWLDGIPIDSTPGLGPISLERRPTPHGMIMAVKYTTP